jgi:type II pantothenate kinase
MNMVFETVGMVSIFAAHQVGCENIVLTGNLTRIAYCKKKFDEFNSMKENYGVNFIIPDNSQFGTVIGTALCGLS